MADNGICRLCLEHAEDLLDIFVEGDFEDVLRIGDVLSHYSIIEVKPDDEISNKICANCWSKVHDFHEFCIRVQKIQESISSIIYMDSRTDVNEVVLANVCDDDETDSKEEISLVQVKNEEVEVVPETLEDTSCVDVDADIPEVVPAESSKSESHISQAITDTSTQGKSLNEKIESQKIRSKSIARRKTISKRVSQEIAEEKESHDKLINSFFVLNCELCQTHCSYCEELFDHYESVHKIRGFIMCCGKKYSKTAKIAEHILWHKKPELFRCPKCDLEKVFSNKKHLESHMLTHIDPDSGVIQCGYCEKTFIKKYRYEQHKLTHLSPEEKKYICRDCGKPYATEALLRVHVRVVHTKSYAHMCEICAKVFKSRVFFEKHQLEHMGQTLPRVQCHICSSWMKNEHTMRAHMRLHEDEGAIHECDLCGKTGPSRNAILKHKRYVHFSERKFKCTLCEKAFKRAVSLKEHMTLHTGEVLYKCAYCTKTFNSGANMFAHKKKLHFSEWKTEKEKEQSTTKCNSVS